VPIFFFPLVRSQSGLNQISTFEIKEPLSRRKTLCRSPLSTTQSAAVAPIRGGRLTCSIGGVGGGSTIHSILGAAGGGVGGAGVGGIGGSDGSAAGVVAGSGGAMAAVKGIPRSSRGSSSIKEPLHRIHRRPPTDLASTDFDWYGFGYAA
jgi:hypothetical protein